MNLFPLETIRNERIGLKQFLITENTQQRRYQKKPEQQEKTYPSDGLASDCTSGWPDSSMNDTRLDARFDGEAESRFSLELYEKGKCYK